MKTFEECYKELTGDDFQDFLGDLFTTPQHRKAVKKLAFWAYTRGAEEMSRVFEGNSVPLPIMKVSEKENDLSDN